MEPAVRRARINVFCSEVDFGAPELGLQLGMASRLGKVTGLPRSDHALLGHSPAVLSADRMAVP